LMCRRRRQLWRRQQEAAAEKFSRVFFFWQLEGRDPL
jgi:hypothetical protein